GERIRLEHIGDGTVGDRGVHRLHGAVDAPVTDPRVLTLTRAAIARMAGAGDGSALRRPVLEEIAGSLPPAQAQRLAAALTTQPDLVPVVPTVRTVIDTDVDARFGTEVRTVRDRTTVL